MTRRCAGSFCALRNCALQCVDKCRLYASVLSPSPQSNRLTATDRLGDDLAVRTINYNIGWVRACFKQGVAEALVDHAQDRSIQQAYPRSMVRFR